MTGRRKNRRAQSTLEFTFAVVVIMFLIFGMVMVFRWAGLDLANRRMAQDRAITAPVPVDVYSAETQLNFDSDTALPMAAMYHGSITREDSSQ